MYKCLTVVALVLLVLTGAMGLRTISAIGGGVPPALAIGGGVPPALAIGGGVPPALAIGGGVPPLHAALNE
jgi:hypothetical protein